MLGLNCLHFSYVVTPCALAQQRGRVIVLSVGRFVSLFVCLSAPTQDFERNRLAYVLYLLRMSQKLKNTYLTNESVLLGAEKSRLFTFFGLC